FPYTTLFRSQGQGHGLADAADQGPRDRGGLTCLRAARRRNSRPSGRMFSFTPRRLYQAKIEARQNTPKSRDRGRGPRAKIRIPIDTYTDTYYSYAYTIYIFL